MSNKKKLDEKNGRPHFGQTQIRTLNGLQKGSIVKLCTSSDQELVCITSEPTIINNKIAIKIVYLEKEQKGIPGVIYLTDYGIMYYPNGMWNETNWLK